ncbi:maleylpyruvate isomerase family mycothiol-dependent enzyme [Mycobacterium sp. SMC-14]|uniref:maleylpyruvate isomerase family mycothiol-dependent enzyme n=1 Tax=Mycobacterium sp. SMC-14 TaxID=3385968 RepID=UPI00390C830F
MQSRKLLYQNDIRFLAAAREWSPTQWAQPSLCTHWTNHDVLAHLALGYRASGTQMTFAMVRRGGSFDRANAVLAQRLAQRRSPAELLEDFATGMSAPRGLGRAFPRRLLLGDHVIHELDIRFALGLDSTIGPAQLAAVLDTQVQIPNPFIPSRAWARGLSLRAEDLHWKHGDGLTVTGNAAHLASVLAGRPWALQHLQGNGVDVLRDRLAG